jgi:glycine cleavage system pyridoxal-binding protein P
MALTALIPSLQHIAAAWNGADELRAVWKVSHFLAQMAHVRLDDADVAVTVIAPYVVQNLLLREHTAFVQEQQVQEPARHGA